MVRAAWIHENVYAVFLSDDEDLKLRQGKDGYVAGSKILRGYVESGLALAERKENKREDQEGTDE